MITTTEIYDIIMDKIAIEHKKVEDSGYTVESLKYLYGAKKLLEVANVIQRRMEQELKEKNTKL